MFTVPIIIIYDDYRSPFDTSVINNSYQSYHQFNSDILPKIQRLPKFWSFAGRGSLPSSLQRRRPLVVAASRHAIRRNHGRWFAVEADFTWLTHSFFKGDCVITCYYCIVFFLFVYLRASPGSNAGLVGRFGDNIRLWHGCRSSEGSEYQQIIAATCLTDALSHTPLCTLAVGTVPLSSFFKMISWNYNSAETELSWIPKLCF